jgi:hypothetical protein
MPGKVTNVNQTTWWYYAKSVDFGWDKQDACKYEWIAKQGKKTVAQSSYASSTNSANFKIKNNKLYSTYDNIERLRRYQVEGYLQWKPFDYTTIVANGYVQHNSYRNLSLQLEKSAWDGFYYVSLTQQLPWKLRLTLSSYGQIGHEPYNVYSYSRSFYSYSAALQRSFLKEDRLTLRLFTYMPFRKYQRSASVTDQGDYTAFSESQYIGRRFQISLSYRFGKLKASVKKTETTIENDDVVGGISKGK